jgi:hypothetical protein
MKEPFLALAVAAALAGCGGAPTTVNQNAQQCMGHDEQGCIPICFVDATCYPPTVMPPLGTIGFVRIADLYVGESLIYSDSVPVYYAGPVPYDETLYVLPDSCPPIFVTWPDGTTGQTTTCWVKTT